MIGKIITKRADAGDPHNLMAYLVFGTGRDREKREPRYSSINFINTPCQSWKDFAFDCQARRDAADGRDNIYHFVIALTDDEKDRSASDEQLQQAAQSALEELGLSGHAAALIVHRDTDFPHIHCAVDLVHPDTYKRKPRPSHDFARLAKACRITEARFGWVRGKGHYAGDRAASREIGEPEPRKPDHSSRKSKVKDADAQSGEARFQARIETNPALQAIFSEAKSWEDLAQRLSTYGQAEFGSPLQYIKYGSGAILALSDDQSARGKASLVNHSASLSKLEKRFGPIPPPRQAAAAPTRATGPTKPADELWTQYQALKASHKTDRAGTDRLRKALTDRQKAESDQLRAAHRQERRFLHAQFFWTHSDRIKADSARAHAAATRREALEIRHKLERQALSKLSRFPSWKEWLSEQATNDPAAADRLGRVRSEKPAPISTASVLSDLKADTDQRTGFVTYRDEAGRLRIHDSGNKIAVARSSNPSEREAAILAALRLSIEKYGVNRVNITSNRAEVIKIAGKHGVWIGGLNPAEQIQWQSFRSASFSSSRTRHAQTRDPSDSTADHARRTRHQAQQKEKETDHGRTHLPDLHLQQDKTPYNAR